MRANRILILPLVILIPALAAAAGTPLLTCYLDGGRVSREVAVRRDLAEVTLPADTIPGSLRVRPHPGDVIVRVQTVPVKIDQKSERALAAIDDRKEALGDRLKALEIREEIFTAAAKSQSGKTARKTKGNPEPMVAIRQGTDFALARLEEVYRARRTVERELKALEARRAELEKRANVGGITARIWTRGHAGNVTVEYAVTGGAWKPFYDVRLDGGGTAGVTVRAFLPDQRAGTVAAVVASRLASPGSTPPAALPASGDHAAVLSLTLPVTGLATDFPLSASSFAVTNTTGLDLPAGDGACFWKGEYLGPLVFPGASPGEKRELRCGGPPSSRIPLPEAGR